MRAYKTVFIVIIGLVLLAVAAVTALLFVDPSIYRNQLETRASAAFDRQFKINGPIRLERSLRPRIIVEDISISNPEWATGTHFATAEKVGVQVALFPLLLGELRILDTAFSGVICTLRKDLMTSTTTLSGVAGKVKHARCCRRLSGCESKTAPSIIERRMAAANASRSARPGSGTSLESRNESRAGVPQKG